MSIDSRTAATTSSASGSRTDSRGAETRTIDFIPENERHGKARNLFTIWFGSNIMMLTIATGLLATTVYGLPVWAAILALGIGNVLGGAVMALHAAQGPQMGIPQMLQTRAQFGSYGSLLVIVIVVAMYVAFFASNAVLGGQALGSLIHIDTFWATAIIGVISVVGVVFGYRLLHAFGTWMSIIAGLTLIASFIYIFVGHTLPAGSYTNGTVTTAGFMSAVTLAALWQIAYAPYVSDYTRYMPKNTGVRPAFWATFAGCVLGSLLTMTLGVLIGAGFPRDATTADALTHSAPGISVLTLLVFGVGIAITNAMNLYCGSLAIITIGQTLFARWIPKAWTRSIIAVVLFILALIIAQVGSANFLTNLSNFMLLLMCVLVPWTAVNLVDYYLVRHGSYDISSLFKRDGGVYGPVNVNAVVCYVIGILVQLPFIDTAAFEGPIAKAFDGIDVSWIVGLVIICPLYYLLMRLRRRGQQIPDLKGN